MLVGTHDVAESEELAARLSEKGVECVVLNAKNDEEEAAIIAEADTTTVVPSDFRFRVDARNNLVLEREENGRAEP